MNIKTILINLITIVFVCTSLYIVKNTNSIDTAAAAKSLNLFGLGKYLLSSQKMNEQVITGTTTSLNELTLRKLAKAQQDVVQKTVSVVVTPGPLQVAGGEKNIDNYSGEITIAGVIDRTNYERAQNQVTGLIESKELDRSAQAKADDILKRQYFEHTAPDGKTVSTLVTAAGYEYIRVGENLALGDFSNNLDLVTAWMNSPGHRANILDKRYQDIGIGIAYGNYKGRMAVVAVQHFGRSRSTCPSVNDKLRAQIIDLQSQATKLSGSLDILKNEIETMRTNGVYVENTIIGAYNQKIADYESLINQSNDLRSTYNVQVKSFNACLASI